MNCHHEQEAFSFYVKCEPRRGQCRGHHNYKQTDLQVLNNPLELVHTGLLSRTGSARAVAFITCGTQPHPVPVLQVSHPFALAGRTLAAPPKGTGSDSQVPQAHINLPAQKCPSWTPARPFDFAIHGPFLLIDAHSVLNLLMILESRVSTSVNLPGPRFFSINAT